MDALLNWAMQYGIWAIYFIIILEYACFPLPSEVILPICGAIALGNNYSLIVVIICSIFCGLIGSIICYIIGYFGGNSVIDWFKGKFPRTGDGIDKAAANFNKYSNFSVCFCRIIPLCRTYISFVAGIGKQNVLKFLLFSFIGTLIWNSFLICLGYFFSDKIEIIASVYNEYKVLFVIIIAGLFVMIIKKLHK